MAQTSTWDLQVPGFPRYLCHLEVSRVSSSDDCSWICCLDVRAVAREGISSPLELMISHLLHHLPCGSSTGRGFRAGTWRRRQWCSWKILCALHVQIGLWWCRQFARCLEGNSLCEELNGGWDALFLGCLNSEGEWWGWFIVRCW